MTSIFCPSHLKKRRTLRNFLVSFSSSIPALLYLCINVSRGKLMVYKLKYFTVTLILLAALSFSFERQAHAYVDPGSGLLIFQGISAVVSGALIYFRRRIKNIF